MKKENATHIIFSKSCWLCHCIERKIEAIIAFNKLNKQSETDKLARIISYILFLRLILAIEMISTIFKMATSILVESMVICSCLLHIIFWCQLCMILNTNIVKLIKYLFCHELLVLSKNSVETRFLVLSLAAAFK